jgi:hypothetical protein
MQRLSHEVQRTSYIISDRRGGCPEDSPALFCLIKCVPPRSAQAVACRQDLSGFDGSNRRRQVAQGTRMRTLDERCAGNHLLSPIHHAAGARRLQWLRRRKRLLVPKAIVARCRPGAKAAPSLLIEKPWVQQRAFRYYTLVPPPCQLPPVDASRARSKP